MGVSGDPVTCSIVFISFGRNGIVDGELLGLINLQTSDYRLVLFGSLFFL